MNIIDIDQQEAKKIDAIKLTYNILQPCSQCTAITQ